jgi:hypothetical protein
VRHGSDLPEKAIVIRIEAPDGRCWSALVDTTVERGCGTRSIDLGVVSVVMVNLEPETPGTWPLFLAIQANGQVVQTFGPTTAQYPTISGGYAVPREVE